MGMHSSVVDFDVDIIDKEGLEEFLKNVKEGKYPEYKGQEYNADGVKIEEDSANPGKFKLNFEGMDGWKIISYWYDSFVMFLRDLAVFVEGQVDLEFENYDEAGYFEFRDGKAIIHWGNMEWQEAEAEESTRQKDGKYGIPPMRDELKKRLLVRKL